MQNEMKQKKIKERLSIDQKKLGEQQILHYFYVMYQDVL